jgi:hypothetical protein
MTVRVLYRSGSSTIDTSASRTHASLCSRQPLLFPNAFERLGLREVETQDHDERTLRCGQHPLYSK